MMNQTPPQLPPVFDATPETLALDAKDIIQTTKAAWDKICADVNTAEATFDNVILPIIHDENVRLVRTRIMAFYPSVASSKELRVAAREATESLNAADIDLYSRADMYGLVISVNAKAQAGIVVLDMESQHYLAKLIGKFIANGCGIQDAYLKAKFTAKLNELKGINSQVVQNFHEEAAGLWFTGEELAGVPASFMARFKQGEEVEHGEPGKQYWVSTKTPFSTPVLRYAKREDTRKKMFYAVKNRLPDNVKLFRQLVLLRDETARLLGYAHHLAMTTSQKTAQTPEFVYSLLNQLRRKVHVAATQNAKELLQLKLASMEKDAALSEDVKVYLWDQMHLAQQQETTRLDQEKVAQYFELHDTFRCILDMIGGLFDTRFVLITPEQQHRLGAGRRLTWHQDVSMYAVWDTRRGDSFLGYAYFDFFSRAGKYSHNGHYATTWGCEQPDGSRFYPSSALVLNLSKPTEKHPTLLSMDNLRMLFHELGHLHHSLLIKTRFASLSSVDRDFVEVPSIMLEQFLWLKDPIRHLSRHYSYISPQMRDAWLDANGNSDEVPPEKLSEEEAAVLAVRDTRSNVRSELTQLFFASYDVLIHAPESHEALEQMNLSEEFNKLQTSIRGLHGGEACGDGWEWSHGESVFRAISGSYSGGYYAYIIGKAWGMDMFVNCFHGDIGNKEAFRRFRDLVLERGGRQPELQTFCDFVGREPKLDAFFSWLGL